MSDFGFNRAKGRIAELAERVNANDPTNAAFLIIPYATSATDATLKDLDSVADIEANANTAEVPSVGGSRKTLDQTGGITITYDDTNDRVDVDVPDPTWVAVTGTAWTDLLFAYDSDTTGGADSAIIPMTFHDFPFTPTGGDVTAEVAAAGFFRAA